MLELTHIPYFVYILIIFASHLHITPAYATKLENETDLLETKYDLWFDSAVFMWSYPDIIWFGTLMMTERTGYNNSPVCTSPPEKGPTHWNSLLSSDIFINNRNRYFWTCLLDLSSDFKTPWKDCCFLPSVGVMLVTGTTSPSTNALAHCFTYGKISSQFHTSDACKRLNHLYLWLWLWLVVLSSLCRCWWMKPPGVGFPTVCGRCRAWVEAGWLHPLPLWLCL